MEIKLLISIEKDSIATDAEMIKIIYSLLKHKYIVDINDIEQIPT